MSLHLLLEQGARPGVAVVALAVVLTCSVHAAVWTLGAASLARRLSRSSRAQNALWRLALFAPFATTCVALALPLGFDRGVEPARLPGVPAAWARGTASLADGARPLGELWGTLGAVVVCCAAVGLLRWLAQAFLLARSLRARTVVRDARWLLRLERLRRRTRVPEVVLTQSFQLTSPLVLGASEICIPCRLLGLEDSEVDTVLAHELAHLERRDGVWFPLAGLVGAVFWLQPFSAWAASRFRQTAEQACDDRAVDLTRDALGLARVLLQLATTPPRSGAALAPSMGHANGNLMTRVTRLTAPDMPGRACSRAAIALVSLGMVIVGLASAGFSVRVAAAHALPSPVAPSAASTAALVSAPGPDAAVVSARAAELAGRAARAQSRLSLIEAERPDGANAVRRLELQQELRHLHQAQQLLEEEFLARETAAGAKAARL